MDTNLKPITKQFLAFIVKKMGITNPYNVKLTTIRTPDFKTFAYYSPTDGKICVYVKNRVCADVLRSVGHEMVHHKQNQDGRINGPTQDIGGTLEDEANALAGQFIKEFGYAHPELLIYGQ